VAQPLPQDPPPPSGDQREDQAAVSAAVMGAIFALAEAKLLQELAYRVRQTIMGALLPVIAARRLRQIVALIFAQVHTQARVVLAQAARDATASAAQVIRDDLSHLPPAVVERIVRRITGAQPEALPELENSLRQAEATAARVIEDAFMKATTAEAERTPADWLARAGVRPFRTAADKYRFAAEDAMRFRTGIGEAVRGLEGAERKAQSLSRLQVAQKMLDDLSSRGVTGFIDKSGREWELASYVEMATRTASSRLHLQLQLAAMGPAGMDLVIVDNPGRHAACPKCRPWEGAVLSLSGASTGDSTITDAQGTKRTERIAGTVAKAVTEGLLHPNCRHSLLPWVNGAGMVPTAGGMERPYIEHGQPLSSPLPIGTP
jgi:hypothetical protein